MSNEKDQCREYERILILKRLPKGGKASYQL